MNPDSKALLLLAAVSLSLRAAPDTQHFRWQEDAFLRAWISRCAAPWSSPIMIRTSRPSRTTGISAWNNGPAVRPDLSRSARLERHRAAVFSGWRIETLDADGRAWLARILPEVIRETAIGAPERVKRILRQQGAGGVLAEVNKIRSDHSRRVYLENLLDYGSLNAEDLRESMRLGRKISSDGEKAGLLGQPLRTTRAPRPANRFSTLWIPSARMESTGACSLRCWNATVRS